MLEVGSAYYYSWIFQGENYNRLRIVKGCSKILPAYCAAYDYKAVFEGAL
jgi:hypothetical protein